MDQLRRKGRKNEGCRQWSGHVHPARKGAGEGREDREGATAASAHGPGRGQRVADVYMETVSEAGLQPVIHRSPLRFHPRQSLHVVHAQALDRIHHEGFRIPLQHHQP